MSGRVGATLALLFGIAVGVGGMLLLQGPAPAAEPPSIAVGVAATTAPATSLPSTTEPAAPDSEPPRTSSVLLVWTPGRLPDNLASAVASIEGVVDVSTVRSGNASLVRTRDADGQLVDRVADGYAIPIEVAALDPMTYSSFVPTDIGRLLASLGDDEAMLGETSARLRRLGVGGELAFADAPPLVVAAVVPDAMIGGAEVVVTQASAIGADRDDRYLLVLYRGDRGATERAIRDVVPVTVPVRLRGPGETPLLRHGDAVLPQAAIKDHFGEFAYRRGPGESLVLDETWVGENIGTEDIPILGSVTCHRTFLPLLRRAMEELLAADLGFLVDPTAYAGCFVPRLIAGGRGISRHTWGVAADINFGLAPTGIAAPQDPDLVAILEANGLTSGHEWLIPDPGHFEFTRFPG